MAITYPRDLRTAGVRFSRADFQLVPRVARAQLVTGTQLLELAPGIWRATFTVVPMVEQPRRAFAAWLQSLAGAKSFLAFDPFQKYPVAHPNGAITGTWADTLAITSVTATTITATAPNANLRLKAGDRVGLEKSGGPYGFYTVLEDAQPSGGAITVTVAPRLPDGIFSSGTRVLRLARPVCEMILDANEGIGLPGVVVAEPYSFAALQKVV